MSRLELQLKNHSMNLELIACIGDNAFLKRLNDNSFIVVNGITINNDFTCEWNFAYGYFESYDRAYQCFNDKVIKEWLEYDDVLTEHNAPETDYDHDYFSSYPYTVEIFNNECVSDIYRTNDLSNAQAKYDSWTSDLKNEQGINIKMFKYNTDTECHNPIDYNGNVIAE